MEKINIDTIALDFPIKINRLTIDDPFISLEQLSSIISEQNTLKSLEGLKQENNPELLDISKVIPFLNWVSLHKQEIVPIVKDKAIYLNNGTLPLSFCYPVTAAQILAGKVLTISENDLSYRPFISFETDSEIAKEHYDEAKKSFEFFDKIVKAEEELLDLTTEPTEIQEKLELLMILKHKRYRSLISWSINATALKSSDYDISKKEYKKIEKYREKYQVPPLNQF